MSGTAPRQSADDYSWETADAPKVSAGRLALPVAAFILWLAILGWMAARRWFGSLL